LALPPSKPSASRLSPRPSQTRNLGSNQEIYYATLIAETSQLAKQMAINEINQKWMVGKRRLAERLECQGSRNQCRWPGPHHRMRLPRGVNSALIAAQPRSSLFVEPWTTFGDRVFS
jgi:hypothetical protein